MAIIYGEVDSFNSLQAHLKALGVNFFSSLDDIIYFKKHYRTIIAEKESVIKAKTRHEINLELEKEKTEVLNLENYYRKELNHEKEFFIKEKDGLLRYYSNYNGFLSPIRGYLAKSKERNLSKRYDKRTKKIASYYKKALSSKLNNIDYIKANYELLVNKKANLELFSLKKAKETLDSYNDLFLGAIGEQKALNALRNLPDAFTIINNFKLKLNKPIYNKRTNERIYSIQADHIVVGPSGVFLIETKNWSKSSINNPNLYSPIDQIKRASFGLFCYLNKSNKSFLQSLWGNKKTIPIKNILLMVGEQPKGKFDYVKVLGLNQVCGYITYFQPTFTQEETNNTLKLLI